MTREELINSKEYEVTTAAIEKYNNYSKEEITELDYVDGFEDGSEWMHNRIIEKACKAYCKPCGYVRKGCTCQKFINFRKMIEE